MANAVTVGLTSLRVRSPRLDSGLTVPPPRPSVTAAAASSSFGSFPKLNLHSGHRRSGVSTAVVKSTPEERSSLVPADDAEDGVLLGTMKLPSDTDVQRFQILLFQWANSLAQGANLPLPTPLKVDKIAGGTRLGFIEIGDGATEVPVYIDCLVFPGNADSVPIFRAVRNGRLKDKTPPGEPRIMRSLMLALQKSVQIARV